MLVLDFTPKPRVLMLMCCGVWAGDPSFREFGVWGFLRRMSTIEVPAFNFLLRYRSLREYTPLFWRPTQIPTWRFSMAERASVAVCGVVVMNDGAKEKGLGLTC